jgi:hypothetical protein
MKINGIATKNKSLFMVEYVKFFIKVSKFAQKKDPGLRRDPTPKTNKPYLTKTYLEYF